MTDDYEEAEVARRRDAISHAKHSLALEGLTVSPHAAALLEDVANGKLTFDEYRAKILAAEPSE